MKVTVSFESTKEKDGVDTKTVYEHDNVEDLSTLAWVFAEAARAGGFTYVDKVAIEKDGGQVVWSLY